jgi:hypothetical protein
MVNQYLEIVAVSVCFVWSLNAGIRAIGRRASVRGGCLWGLSQLNAYEGTTEVLVGNPRGARSDGYVSRAACATRERFDGG